MARPEKEDDEKKDEDNVDDKQTDSLLEEGEESKKKKRKRKRKRSKKSASKEEEEKEQEDAAESSNNNVREDDTVRTAFVEGVPYDATTDQVAECLLKHTKIERRDITDLRFPTWQDSGRMRGYGHVVFTSKEILDQVLEVANNQKTKLWMGRRYLSLQKARPKGNGIDPNTQHVSAPSKTIMIKKLDYQATEEDIIQVMEQFGTIVDGGVRIARNFKTRQNKGFAYIAYEELESAKKAMEHQQKQPNKPICILNRACILDYDEGRMKGSFKTATGRLWSREYQHQQPSSSGTSNKQARTK
ncbi:Heterogeneous nuclear ribonucleoprotein D-like [Seminavis robusta]|uniref:Heterogeneous nuclear ribonucleoprotein D-like n=1 Tax=Seminavis robusta TaxID=568900 RepID=A0A9N8HJE1_9STRA|nr:Heterogeneous nuclear ribonucleoprotein D-like [Seminavis robusta]|eukprot:Sro547_g164180.1 Heterogeneous nuclear ribonucleoprotein D-like (301) ;mRNA; f:2455-3357